MKYALMLYAILLSALLASVAPNGNAKVCDFAEHALQQSQLTLPGSRPFHLQAALVLPQKCPLMSFLRSTKR